MKKRIAYLLDGFPVISETFVINEILELEKRGWQIDIYSLYRPLNNDSHEVFKKLNADIYYISDYVDIHSSVTKLWSLLFHPVSYYSVSCYARQLPNSYRWVANICLSVAARIANRGTSRIHSHFAGPAAQWAMMTAYLAKIPYTVTAHGSDIFHRPLPQVEKLYSDADICITVTQYNKNYILERYGLPESKFVVIPSGVNTVKFGGCNDKKRIAGRIVTVARLAPEKNIQMLISALAILKSRNVNFDLKLIGDGPEKESIEKCIKANGLDGHVELLGAQSSDVVFEHLREAEVFALTSERESLGVVYLEAMIAGVPVVGTDVMGVSEAVKDGKTGFLVASNDIESMASKLELLLKDARLRSTFGQAGREWVKNHFSLEAQISALEEIFSGSVSKI